MEAPESTGWLLAGLVYRKITGVSAAVSLSVSPVVRGLAALPWSAVSRLVSVPCLGFSSSTCLVLRGAERELRRPAEGLSILSSTPGEQVGRGEGWARGSMLKGAVSGGGKGL